MASPKIEFISSPDQLDHYYDILIPDTNVLLSYPFLAPSAENPTIPSDSSIGFNHKHIVIPSIIDHELDHLKGQHISISVAARNAIRRLESLTDRDLNGLLGELPSTDYFTLEKSFELKNNILISYTDDETGNEIDLLFGFWSIANDISVPPFYPKETDPDGIIIASALKIGETKWFREMDPYFPSVTLLSNDYNVRFRARNFGLKALPYDLTGPGAYSGRRAVNAPRNIYRFFLENRYLTGQIWRQYFPNEAPLSPNEFIAFYLPQPKPNRQKTQSRGKNTKRNRRKHGRPNKPTPLPQPVESSRPQNLPQPPSERFNFIGRYDSDLDRIVALEYLDQSPVPPENVGQAIHAEAMMNPKIGVIIIDNNPHYRSDHVAIITYRAKEPAFTDDIYDKFNFN